LFGADSPLLACSSMMEGVPDLQGGCLYFDKLLSSSTSFVTNIKLSETRQDQPEAQVLAHMQSASKHHDAVGGSLHAFAAFFEQMWNLVVKLFSMKAAISEGERLMDMAVPADAPLVPNLAQISAPLGRSCFQCHCLYA